MTTEPPHGGSISHWLGLATFVVVLVVLVLELVHLRRPGDSNRRDLGAVAAWIALALAIGVGPPRAPWPDTSKSTCDPAGHGDGR